MTELLTQPFFLRALLGGLAIALMCAWLGVFVVMRKMSFLADALAHGSLAGIALGFLLGVEPIVVAAVTSIVIALGMAWLERRSKISHDTVIGIFFAGSLAIGVVLLSFIKGYRPDVTSFLFGNILAMTTSHLIWTWLTAIAIVIVMQIIQWRLLLVTLDPEGARLMGMPVVVIETVFTVLMAIAIVVSIKVVGLILVTALLVIPAASAKNVTHSYSSLHLVATVAAIASVLIGLLLSTLLNIPSGACIVLTSIALFGVTLIVKQFRPRVV